MLTQVEMCYVSVHQLKYYAFKILWTPMRTSAQTSSVCDSCNNCTVANHKMSPSIHLSIPAQHSTPQAVQGGGGRRGGQSTQETKRSHISCTLRLGELVFV